MMDTIEFWSKQHLAADALWLTGTPLASVLAPYGMNWVKDLDVTEIGVGLGLATREFAKLGNRVSAVDIVPAALDRVKACTVAQFLVGQMARAAPADLAVAHLVFQHCALSMVQFIIESVQLKPGGLFLCQTAEMLSDSADMARLQQQHRAPLFWRDPITVELLLDAAGLRIDRRAVQEHVCMGARVKWTLFVARRP